MEKQQIRDYIKGLFGGHIEFVEKVEQHKQAKIEMPDKVNRMLELLKYDGLEEKGALAKLILDLQKQYQILYADYDRLTGALKEDDSEYYTLVDQVSMIQQAAAQREISLQVELETTQAKDSALLQLDSSQFEKEKQELHEYVEQLDADKIELRSKITGSRGKLDKVYSKLTEVHKQLDDLFQEQKFSTESKDRIMADLEKLSEDLLSEDLKRELEVNGDELSYLSSLVQKSHDTDFQFRPKPGVTEEVLNEKEQNYGTAEQKHQEDQNVLEDKTAAAVPNEEWPTIKPPQHPLPPLIMDLPIQNIQPPIMTPREKVIEAQNLICDYFEPGEDLKSVLERVPAEFSEPQQTDVVKRLEAFREDILQLTQNDIRRRRNKLPMPYEGVPRSGAFQ